MSVCPRMGDAGRKADFAQVSGLHSQVCSVKTVLLLLSHFSRVRLCATP